MDKMLDRVCGIDLHKDFIVACLFCGKNRELRNFGTTTSQLLSCVDWLQSVQCEMIAMESTGSYWKPIVNILEAYGLPFMVVNAQHMKNVPGRKYDTGDAEWIAQLTRSGLLRASYIPSREQRELRELVTYRKSLIQMLTAELNRLQKMLEGSNIKLSSKVSSINGLSARNLLNVMLNGGNVTKEKIEKLYEEKKLSRRLKATCDELVEAMNGFMSPLQQKMMKEVFQHIDELNTHIAAIEDDITNHMNDEEKECSKLIQSIPGIGDMSANTIISISGTDMTRFPTAQHFASWGGMCPGNNESAGKRKSGKTRKGNRLLKTTLVICAHAAVKNKDSFFYAQFHRLCGRIGAKRAYVAVGHSMLISIYHMLKKRVPFKDLGAKYYNQFNPEKKLIAYLKKIENLGYTATVTQPAPAGSTT